LPEGAIPYKAHEPVRSPRKPLERRIKELINTGSPVHRDELSEMLRAEYVIHRQEYGYRRRTPRWIVEYGSYGGRKSFEQSINLALQDLHNDGALILRSAWVWRAGQDPDDVQVQVNVGGETRPLEYYSPEEIGKARQMVKDATYPLEADVPAAITRFLGYRATKRAVSLITQALKLD
jgi:hypothetical protein